MTFILPVRNLAAIIGAGSDCVLEIETAGLLSSMGGGSAIMALLGTDCIVDPGTWLRPIIFKCNLRDLAALQALLEERLRDCAFDRDESALVIRRVM